MATLVETKDAKIAIDPDAALGPSRYGLAPHPKELLALAKAKRLTHKAASKSDAIVLTHYHFDHFDIGGDWFKGKTLYVKSIKKKINKSQTQRGTAFKEAVEDIAELVEADGKEFELGGTKLKFSPPVPHGPPGIRLGYVLMVLVDDGFKFVHASDVQGPVAKESTDWIIKQKPDLIYMDGPPILFLGWKFSYKNLEQAEENFKRLLDKTKAKIILDHHLLRSLDYKEKFPVWDDKRVMTAAEFLGKKNNMFEARRKELWGKSK
jgi:predicted metallo-beta-lactamase superfamily hydrolase